MDETLKEMETELASLRQELIDISNDIKVCRTKEEREELFEDKKLTQLDIEEVTSEIARYKELLSQADGLNSDETASENEETDYEEGEGEGADETDETDETDEIDETDETDEIDETEEVYDETEEDETEEDETPQDKSENDEDETVETEEA
jgi:hypothetical protein